MQINYFYLGLNRTSKYVHLDVQDLAQGTLIGAFDYYHKMN